MMTWIDMLNDTLWTWLVIPMLVCCALLFTWRLRGVQFRKLPHMIRLLFESTDTGKEDKTGKKTISSFHAFTVSLSSRIGTGNLAGVASAIFVGGAGAVFWMWVMALLGAATAFAESTLAQLYKRRGEHSYYGGPAYYMRYGLKSPLLGTLFSAFLMITFGCANQMMQSNQICASMSDTFSWSPLGYACVLAVLTAVIIVGGIHRIAGFTAVVVPFMAVAYLLLTIYIIGSNIFEVPSVLRMIVEDAFGIRPAAGGTIGMVIMQGVKRGLFSNEAGEGSAPNAAAVAETSHPVRQGLVQALGVFTDTILVCTCTALIILLSGVYTQGSADGILLTTRALETTFGNAARYFVSVTIFFFAYSSIIGNYYYGETAIRYLSHKKWIVRVFRIFTIIMVVAGGVLTLTTIWSVIDLCMCSIVILNVYALMRLSPIVVKLWKDYAEQLHRGDNPRFNKDTLGEDADGVEVWQ